MAVVHAVAPGGACWMEQWRAAIYEILPLTSSLPCVSLFLGFGFVV